MRLLLIVFCLIVSQIGLSQDAVLKGRLFKVVEAEEVPLDVAKVLILSSDSSSVLSGVNIDYDGTFELKTKPGKNIVSVRAAGFDEQILILDLVAGENPDLVLEVSENKAVVDLGVAVIVGHKRMSPNSVKGDDNRRKDATGATDGMTSEQMKKSGDNTAGDAVQRVPGVSVQDGKYVYVRGLGDRYVKTILNGVEIPGLDPDRNTVQLDIFPTAIVDNITVYKTFTPDLSGDFTGGLVDVITRDYPLTKELKFNLGGGYNSEATFSDNFIGYDGGNLDFLGFDDGTRALNISPYAKTIDPTQGDEKTTAVTKSFNPTMGFSSKTAIPNMKFGFSFGDFKKKAFKSDKFSYGYLTAFNYRNTNSINVIPSFGNYIRSQDENETELETLRVSEGVVAQNDVIWSGLLNQTLIYNTKHKFTLAFFHTQNGTSSASSIRENIVEGNPAVLIKQGLQYTQRQVTNLSLRGGHTYDKLKVSWVVAPTLSKISDPDLRSTILEEVKTVNTAGDTAVTYELNQSVGGQIRRMYRNLDEKSLNSKLNFTYAIPLSETRTSKFDFGVFNVTKKREFSVYDYTFEMQNSTLSTMDPNAYFQEDNIWTVDNNEGLYTRGQIEPANQYIGTQMVSGAFLMNEMPFSSKLNLTYGARLEKADNIYTGSNNSGTIEYNNEKVLDELNILPSVNLLYKLPGKNANKEKKQTNFRLAFSQTVARPSFREKSIAQIYDPILDRTFNGNINLEQTKIFNYDLRWESFFGRTELISASVFYKKLINPIEIATYETAPNDVKPVNAGEAEVFGAEIELRKAIGFKKKSQNHLNLIFGTNMSYVKSRIDMTKVLIGEGDATASEFEIREANLRGDETAQQYRPMYGQSPYSINAFANFSNDKLGFTFNVSYNVQGPRLSVVGVGLVPDVYEQPFHSLNLKTSKSFGEGEKWNLSITGSNLLNQVRNQYFVSYDAADKVYSSSKPGISFSTSISYTFH